MLTDVPIWDVLFTVFQSIFEVFLLCVAGFTLSFKGIVDKPTSKVLNHINVSLFTPALLFSKVAFFLTPAKLRQLWVIPIFFVITTGLSAITAHWLARALRLKRSQVNFATAASMFMNSNSLPVALMQSLATTVPLLKRGPDDTIDAMFGRSLTYLVVFSTLGMIVRWSYGIRLLAQADEPESASAPPTTYRDGDDTHGHPELTHAAVDSPTTTQLVDCETDADIEPHDRIPWRTRPMHSRLTAGPWRHIHPHLHLHSHLPAVPTPLGDQSESEDSDEFVTTEGDSEDTIALRSEPIDTGFSTEAEDAAPALVPSSSSPDPNAPSAPRWGRPTRSWALSPFMRLLTTLASLSPPLIASLLALSCVLVPPLQRFLKSDVMIPLRGALDNTGGCSIPLTLIVLGGWFWDPSTNRNSKGGRVAEDEGKGGSDGAKSKGKGVEKRHDSHVNGTCAGQQGHPHGSPPHLEHRVTSYSRDSSTASFSSLIEAFGDVLMARIHPRGGCRPTRRRARGDVEASKGDIEPGLLATHTETENDNAENGFGCSSPSRSQTNHARLSSNSSPTSQLSVPKSPRTRGTNPPGETLTIFVTLLARMVIVPLVVTPMMVLVSRLGWGGEVFEDPVFIVSSMLLVSSPPALTLAQISQRAKVGTRARQGSDTDADAFSPFERLLSRTVFWAYCVLTPPVTIFVLYRATSRRVSCPMPITASAMIATTAPDRPPVLLQKLSTLPENFRTPTTPFLNMARERLNPLPSSLPSLSLSPLASHSVHVPALYPA
ncbi:membrane transport protein-domain-containing protein [Butyriboletus roseoflavus]|nr:membrane transport protein-domain-containing protein [Butyriboletus roseoflavus]